MLLGAKNQYRVSTVETAFNALGYERGKTPGRGYNYAFLGPHPDQFVIVASTGGNSWKARADKDLYKLFLELTKNYGGLTHYSSNRDPKQSQAAIETGDLQGDPKVQALIAE